MPKKSTQADIPIFELDRSSLIWYRDWEEDLRLPFPAEFEFSYIDLRGQIVIAAPFQCARSYSHGRAAVCHYPMKLENGLHVLQVIPRFQEGWKLIDANANVLTHEAYDFIAPFREEKVTVACRGKNSVLLDWGGDVLATYHGVRAISAADGRIVTQDDSAQLPYGLIDYNGDKVSDQRFFFIGEFGEGLAAAKNMNFTNSAKDRSFIPSWFGYIGKQGELVIDDKFAAANSFHHGYANVKKTQSWAMIDTKGKTVLDSKFDYLGQYDAETGLIPMRSKNLCGFVDLNGKEIIKPSFAAVKKFSQGLAPATLDGLRWGYIDRSGQFAIEPTFQMGFSFSDDRALVCCDIGGPGPKQPLDSKNPTHLVSKARELRNQYKYLEARELFDKIIESAPGTLAAKQAEAFKKTELPTAAPAPIISLYAAAIVESTIGKLSEAEAKLIECIETEPNFEPAFGALASIYIRSERLDLAKELLLRILSEKPNYVRTLDFLALTYRLQGDKLAAEAMEKKLLKLNPYFRMDQ